MEGLGFKVFFFGSRFGILLSLGFQVSVFRFRVEGLGFGGFAG